MFVGLFFSFSLSADNVIQSYDFEQPQLKTKGNFTEIIYKNCHNFGPEGAPGMPQYAAEILLPPGHELIAIEIESMEFYPGERILQIAPAARQFPLSQLPDQPYKVVPNEKIYNLKGKYPENPIDNIVTQYLSGHAVGGFTFCPVVYYPAEQKAKFVKSVKFNIKTQATATSKQSLRFLKEDQRIQQKVTRRVSNPESLKLYNYPNKSRTEDVDILLITNQTLMPGFEDYINYKTNTGFIVETIDVDDIYSNYSGTDNPEKIRNCIIDYYQNHNLKYVVLGGDADGSGSGNIVPTRGMAGDAYGLQDEFIPADIYYSGLDGTWDDDEDGVYGESGEEDLLAEVFVGRIAADNIPELEKFVNKIIMYQNQPVIEDLEKALMVGELLWADPTYGGDYKDEVAYGAETHGYTTSGFPDNFQINKLYDRDADWSQQDVYDEFSLAGVNLLNHLGHCGVTYHMTLENSDITTSNFQNDGTNRSFVIDYSQGCYCGSFDNRGPNGDYSVQDCFAEEFTNFDNGAVACIMNSRYGWGQPSSTDGASQYYDRQFFDAIFSEGLSIIGETYADSKSDNIAFINGHAGAMRWCAYALNLFGDPSMDIWTAEPTDVNVNYNVTIDIGSTQLYVETDAPYARIALLQNGQLIGRSVADGNGNAFVQMFNELASPAPITISMIAHNRNRYEGTIMVLSDAPYVGLDSYTLSGAPDYGTSQLMNIKMKNYADVGSGYHANNILAKLRTSDPYITITDSIADLGNINAGDSVFLTNAFAFNISDSVKDQHRVTLEIFVTGTDKESYEWTSITDLRINAPKIVTGSISINDSENGNNNGILDQGENVTLDLETFNNGHATVNNVYVSCEIVEGAEFLSFNSDSIAIGTMEVGQMSLGSFEVTADENTPQGSTVLLNYSVVGGQSGQYNTTSEKSLIIGFVPEYCESGATVNSDTEIEEVAFGSVINNTDDACGTYSDFTEDEGLTDVFLIGESFDLSVTLGTCGLSINKAAKVYIDWNYDGDFEDDGEMVFETPESVSTTTFTETILIPEQISEGQRFIRLVAVEGNEDIDPCGFYSWGETEDYKIYLLPSGPPIADFEAYPTETTLGDIVEFTDMTQNAPCHWEWSITPGIEGVDYEFVNGTTSANQHPHVKFHTVNNYNVELVASNSEGDNSELKTDYIVINEITEVPEAGFSINANVIESGDIVQFTDQSTNTPIAWDWSISPGAEGVDYEYTDGTNSNSSNPNVQFYTSGIYTIELVASNIIGSSDPFILEDALEVLLVVLMDSDTITVASGLFYDDGGADNNYSDNANYTMSFYPEEQGQKLKFLFTEFMVEGYYGTGCEDVLTVYDGEDVNAPLIGDYCYTSPLEAVEASNESGALTFVFSSNDNVNQTGWVANFSYVGPDFNVTFSVSDSVGPIQGAEILVDDNTLITDASGEASISLPDGTYDYIVTVDGVGSENGTFTVAGEDLFIDILAPQPMMYMVTFHVMVDGVPTEGATVTCPAGTMATDINGDASMEMPVGTHNYTVNMQNYEDIHGTVEVEDGPQTVNVEMLGIGDAHVQEFRIYPNPNRGKFTIEVAGSYDLEVLNAIGNVVYSARIMEQKTVDLSNENDGIYFIRLQNGEKIFTKRLIINK